MAPMARRVDTKCNRPRRLLTFLKGVRLGFHLPSERALLAPEPLEVKQISGVTGTKAGDLRVVYTEPGAEDTAQGGSSGEARPKRSSNRAIPLEMT